MARSGSALPLPTPPASSSPSPEPTSPRRPAVAMFGQTTTDEQETTPASEHLEPDVAAWGSPDLEPSDLPEPSAGRRTSSPASSGSAVLSREDLRKAMREGVTVAGEMMHEHLTRDQLEREYDLYLADEDDAQGIGDPVANMVHRRGLTKVADPDLVDAIKAAVALAKYLYKQYRRWTAARATRQAARVAIAEPGSAPVGTEDPAGVAFGPQEG